MSKIRFLHVKKEYIDFLKLADNKVQNNYDNAQHQKPYISGITIEVNGKAYLAPLTSYKESYAHRAEKVIFKIIKSYEKKSPEMLGVILLNNMIPLIDGVALNIDFSQYDKHYANLLTKQYRCLSNKEAIEKINKIANTVYKEVTEHQNPFFVSLSCDFKKLEDAANQYILNLED
ncbi:type III toxin-antitoxin system ToxN/AbiQ family toxin [Haemophilus parahaemolyticus]|jgi:hypothetical protein|uniref:type III toxin-antitoxin system ToxN/AbiQ family toxin n=1 Tax=Haemophilus parahaemolyticus TaxID=735 RepID=UPI00288B9D86|nr:type III toxin-antitoxin system ToxN/AbiQ family toxin [Haemophilus parahaemolyticus]MDU4465208.1 type III toxin-antitoxin system ToxN/AbiQ family toxin [Haemophilus parahaemolyticus]